MFGKKRFKFIGENIVRIEYKDDKTLDELIGKGYKIILGDSWEQRVILVKPKDKSHEELGVKNDS